MAEIRIQTEQDVQNGWLFEVVLAEGGRTYSYRVVLNWSDYDLWSHGKCAPEKVIEALFQFLLEREPPEAILSSFDCAVVRRYFREVDRVLPERI